MARGVWSGSINFGLVNVAVKALTAGSEYTFTVGARLLADTADATGNVNLSNNITFGTSTTLAYLDVQEVQIP